MLLQFSHRIDVEHLKRSSLKRLEKPPNKQLNNNKLQVIVMAVIVCLVMPAQAHNLITLVKYWRVYAF